MKRELRKNPQGLRESSRRLVVRQVELGKAKLAALLAATHSTPLSLPRIVAEVLVRAGPSDPDPPRAQHPRLLACT
jgi:hypothetical protein